MFKAEETPTSYSKSVTLLPSMLHNYVQNEDYTVTVGGLTLTLGGYVRNVDGYISIDTGEAMGSITWPHYVTTSGAHGIGYNNMGSLRYKTSLTGPFLSNPSNESIPPLERLALLEDAAFALEEGKENAKELHELLSPGSSLGGARPKANVQTENGELWIAKFPRKDDDYDQSLWEMVAYELAQRLGIEFAPSLLRKDSRYGSTFLTKRFDRDGQKRIPFVSMLFSRTVARRDAILNGFACAILAIASMVINIIVAVQNKSSAGVLENVLLSLIILMVGLWIAVSYLKNNKVSAYIAALVVMALIKPRCF